jgi:hypothetical protein
METQMSGPLIRSRTGAVALAAAGALFILYPAIRPWADESTVDGATQSMSSDAWVAAHAFAMIGFILVPVGLLAVFAVVGCTRSASTARAAVLTGWLGAGLTLPYFGAEDFALHAIAAKAAQGQPVDLLTLVEAVRFGPVAATMFGLGLLTLGAAAILTAIAIWRSGILPRAGGVPFAVGFALLVPQFYAPAAARIGHGVLVAVGLAWIARSLWNTPTA